MTKPVAIVTRKWPKENEDRLKELFDVTLNDYRKYSAEWEGSDLVYRADDAEIYRNIEDGDTCPKKMFAILNFAKITDAPMKGE